MTGRRWRSRAAAGATATAALFVASAAAATPACPPGTGSPPHLGWYFGAPFLLGAAVGVPLFVSGVRHTEGRVVKIVFALAAVGAGFLVGAAAFLVYLSSCVPK